MRRVRLEISGVVQEVGFRPFVFNLAKSLNDSRIVLGHVAIKIRSLYARKKKIRGIN